MNTHCPPVTAPPADDEPSRTPLSAEGKDECERQVPCGEPGKTPGSAEGEDVIAQPNPDHI